jgi:hypothetical protein
MNLTSFSCPVDLMAEDVLIQATGEVPYERFELEEHK